jgi:hypothetical protein
MKKIIVTPILIFYVSGLFAQLNSSNLNVPPTAQPVPNATVTEKSATPQPQNITPLPNPVPPIYPGAEVKPAETQRQLVYPPSTPSATQPVQKEPLSPIESTNNLQPNRPQREEASRKNTIVETNKNYEKNTPVSKNIGVVGSTNTLKRTDSSGIRNKDINTNIKGIHNKKQSLKKKPN